MCKCHASELKSNGMKCTWNVKLEPYLSKALLNLQLCMAASNWKDSFYVRTYVETKMQYHSIHYSNRYGRDLCYPSMDILFHFWLLFWIKLSAF